MREGESWRNDAGRENECVVGCTGGGEGSSQERRKRAEEVGGRFYEEGKKTVCGEGRTVAEEKMCGKERRIVC